MIKQVIGLYLDATSPPMLDPTVAADDQIAAVTVLAVVLWTSDLALPTGRVKWRIDWADRHPIVPLAKKYRAKSIPHHCGLSVETIGHAEQTPSPQNR